MFRIEIVLELLMDDIDYIKRQLLLDKTFKDLK